MYILDLVLQKAIQSKNIYMHIIQGVLCDYGRTSYSSNANTPVEIYLKQTFWLIEKPSSMKLEHRQHSESE